MTKNEFLKQNFEEILKSAVNMNFLKQRIENQFVLTILLKNLDDKKIIQLIEMNPDILSEKNENSVSYSEVLADLGKINVLDKFFDKIDLLQKSSLGEKNMLGYFVGKGLNNLVLKCLQYNSGALNKKDFIGCVGTERLADANFSNGLVDLASKIDLLQRSYDGERNMLGYLAKKGMSNALMKAIEHNPQVLNERDPIGCVGTERLADAGYTNILQENAEHINLLERSYDSERNMLGYLSKKGMSTVLMKAIEYNPEVLNEKDPIGCVGTERLADAGYTNILQENAEHIDLLKSDYLGEKNMLGYLTKKGMSTVLMKAIEHNPQVLNEKDPIGMTGTERLANAGYTNILLNFAKDIDLLKTEYQGQINMLGYLIKKGMSEVVLKSLEFNLKALNERDYTGKNGVERLIDSGHVSIINKYVDHIDWNKKTINDQSIFQYLLKKAGGNAGEIAIKVLSKNADLLKREMKFIIDSGNSNLLSYKEIINNINKNMLVGEINLLGYLTNKNKESIVDIILNPDKAKYYFKKEETQLIPSAEIDKEVIMEKIKINKELIKEKEKEQEKEEVNLQPKSIKAKIKSML